MGHRPGATLEAQTLLGFGTRSALSQAISQGMPIFSAVVVVLTLALAAYSPTRRRAIRRNFFSPAFAAWTFPTISTANTAVLWSQHSPGGHPALHVWAAVAAVVAVVVALVLNVIFVGWLCSVLLADTAAAAAVAAP